MQGVQVKLCYPLTMRAIPERLIETLRVEAARYTNRYTYLYLFIPLPYIVRCQSALQHRRQ